jgi:hypothetical protein
MYIEHWNREMFRGLCEHISWVARRSHNNNGAFDLRRIFPEDVNRPN